MKKKVLFFGWGKSEWKNLLEQTKKWQKDYEILPANFDKIALHRIANANFEEKSAIGIIVFNRKTLVDDSKFCKTLVRFAEFYLDGFEVIAINLISNDQDTEARNCSVGAYFAREEDWEQIFTIIGNHSKS